METLDELTQKLDSLYGELKGIHANRHALQALDVDEAMLRIQVDTMLILGKLMCYIRMGRHL